MIHVGFVLQANSDNGLKRGAVSILALLYSSCVAIIVEHSGLGVLLQRCLADVFTLDSLRRQKEQFPWVIRGSAEAHHIVHVHITLLFELPE